MDLSTIDPAVIEARGQYATVNGEYKTAMSNMQALTQKACDDLRHALNAGEGRESFLYAAQHSIEAILAISKTLPELQAQKDELYQSAWGKK